MQNIQWYNLLNVTWNLHALVMEIWVFTPGATNTEWSSG